MKKISLPAPAKINLFLHIVGRREDGYHLLQSLFHYLDYGDSLHFELRADNKICLHPQEHLGINEQDNLIYKAARALQQSAQCNQGVNIHWEKRLPLGSGLGGGSSNAATCLLALNALWDLNWSQDNLINLGVTLGADVPFFLFGHTALGEGIGEKLTALTIAPTWFLVITPDCNVATPKMYALSELTRNTPRLRIGTLVEGGINYALSECRNDFEPVVRQHYAEVNDAFKWLSNYSQARMSGSGASVFASFSTKAQAQEVAQQLPAHLKGFIAKGMNSSPLMQSALSKGIINNDWGVAKR
ncbi:MAG: 4-(cytidine 5'-diphospho)-2-C-methyl-D-erythritol kinase [Proteobacteria bacterium]|nr:4-(cytidine 5'-diphospho)-2-C-methyl-D-erythritol kinase [Pseudomonadota bacterium]